MGRVAVPDVIKIRQAAMRLTDTELEELQHDIEIILETREAAAEKLEAANGKD